MPETSTKEGVAARAEAATPYAFLNRRLAPCRYCDEIHDHVTRGCVTLVAYGGTRGYEIGAAVGEPEELDELPHRWRPFKAPDSPQGFDESVDDQTATMREVFDPVYGRSGEPL